MKLIAIHSMPRSGSTWLGSIIDSSPYISYKLQPLFSYKLKGFLTEVSDLNRLQEFKNKLLMTQDDFLDQTEKKQRGIIPAFEKKEILAVAYKETRYHYILKNLLQKDHETVLIGLIRNPLAQLNSWFKAPKEFDPNWKIEEEWRLGRKKNKQNIEEYYGFEKWKEVSLLIHELKTLFPKRIFIVNYNDLLNNPIEKTNELFSFVELPYTKQTETFLVNSRMINNKDPYGVFKSKQHDDDWKKNLPKFIAEEVFDELIGTELEIYLK